jgi:2-polyprenyl-6-methoxyphenol hydroxylase-like FAD-dependent oxidoreductase
MSDTDRVLVVGGGIGGLAAANALRARNVPITVLEQAPQLDEIGAAIGMQTNAVRALRSTGLADRLISTGVPIEYYEYVSWRGRRLVRWSQGDIGRRLGEPTVVVHRGDLQRVLLGGLDDLVELRLAARAREYEEDADGVTVHLADGSSVRGGLLIAADGLRSVFRRQLLGDEQLRYSGWVAYRGIAPFSDAGLPVGLARQTLGRGRTFGTWHLPGGRIYWVATLTEPAGGTVPQSERRRKVLDAFAGAHNPIRALVSATPEDALLRHEVHDRLPATRWSSRRVTLLGDAAHPTTPVTGQGGGQAIIDASVLADELGEASTLRNAPALREALRRYEARRRPVTAGITQEAWRIAAMHHVRWRAVALGRDASFRLTPTRVWNKRMEQRLAF